MTGICRGLLAIFSPIFVASIFIVSIFVAPVILRGQDEAADRSPNLAPTLDPTLSPLRYSTPVAPVWIPPPRLPKTYPVGPGTIGLQRIFFSQLVRSAGIIFSGRVTSIGRAPSSPGQARVSTSITFQVERAMRGASPGRSLTIHEWAGLWSGGERYRVGEHVLLFLYSPSKLGLTSPVAGAMGRFAVDSEGRIKMSLQHVEALAADPVLGGKAVIPYADFVRAVQRSSGEE